MEYRIICTVDIKFSRIQSEEGRHRNDAAAHSAMRIDEIDNAAVHLPGAR
jgi:hypothetical protein